METKVAFYAGSAMLAATIFAFDISLPLGVAGGVPYVALVLLGLWSPWRDNIIALGVVASALTVVGFYLSPEGTTPWIVLTNRALALLVIWGTALATYQHQRRQQAYDQKATLLTATFDNLDEGFCVYDAAWNLVAYNKSFEQMIGFPPGFLRPGLSQEQITRYRVEAGHFGDGDVEELVRQRLDHRNQEPGDKRELTLPSGLSYSFKRKPMPDGGHVNAFIDITERKRAEQATAENSGLLDTALQIMVQGIVIYGPDRKVAAYNDKYLEMAGLPTDCEPLGMSHEQILRLRAKEGKTAEVLTEEVIQKRVKIHLNFPQSPVEHVRDDGTAFIYHRLLLPGGGSVSTYTDITERHRAEQAEAQKSTLLDTALQVMAQGFAVYNSDQKIVAHNAKFIEMSRLPPDCQPLGMSHEEILRLRAKEGKTAEPLTEEIIQRRLANTQDKRKSVREHVNDDGTAFLFHRLPLPGGGYVVTYTDITEQKRAQELIQDMNVNLEEKVTERTAELQSAQEDLLRAERLATLGQLTGTVAHELRNPLGAVALTARVIEQKIEDAGLDLGERFARLNRGIQRCDNIITELLDFARAKGLEVEATALDLWVSETLDEIDVPQGVTLHTSFDATGVVPDFDRDRLRRALINLVDNSCQAMGDCGGDLTVATHAESERVEITIADNGPGIPEDVMPKIFEPLYSTKQFGVGLGLPTVRQILEEHGGGFELSSAENKGTRATLWLPLTSPAKEEARR